ncbi:MAG: anti-sigma factor domain-containing protein [Thermoactinomyces sp.]
MNEDQNIRKGIVVDILKKERKVIVLMPDGDLQKVRPHRFCKIGEEISFKQDAIAGKWFNQGGIIRFAASGVAILLIMTGIFFSVWSTGPAKDVYAEIFIESKSDVQVKLNKEQEVVKVIPLNKSGTRVVRNLQPEGEPMDEFINDYFEEMKNEGYIGAEDKAIISVISDEDIKKRDEILAKVKEAIGQSDFIQANEIEVLTVSIPYQTARKADQLGVTPGKYSIAMIADSVGEGNIPSLGVLKLITVTELVNTNPEAVKILASASEVELVELTEQQAPGMLAEAEDGQSVTAMNPPESSQTVAETAVQQNTPETKEEPAVQTSMDISEKQGKPVKNDGSSTSAGSRQQRKPPSKGNEEPSGLPKEEAPDEQKPANPPSDKQPAGEVETPSDKQPADSDQDQNTGSEEKPAAGDDEGKQNEDQAKDKKPTILDQVLSLVLNLNVL